MLPKQGDESKANDDEETPPLHLELISAAMRGDKPTTTELMANPDLDINGVDDKGNSALHWAAYFDEVKVMKLLISSPNTDLALKSNRGNTALHMAAVANAGNALTCLLTLGTKRAESLYNEQNVWGETALHLAASTGKIKSIEILCNAKVDTTLADNWSRTALRVAFENLEHDAIKTLSPYCSARVVEDAKKVEESRMKLGGTDAVTKTSVKGMGNNEMMAEFMNEMQSMQQKIKQSLSLTKIKEKHAFDVGGKVVDRNETTRPPLPAAAAAQRQYKYKLASKFEYGVSPKTLEQLNDWLQDDEIDNNGKDMFGWSALHKTIFWQKNEFVLPLLDAMDAGSINCIGPEGDPALHMALSLVLNGGKQQILEWMCNCPKIDKGQKNKAGFTAKESAIQNNANQGILQIL